MALEKYCHMPQAQECKTLPVLVKTRKMSRNRGRRLLAHAMNMLGVRSGIEIGTRRGDSALHWCKAIPGLKLTCVDPYVPYYQDSDADSVEKIYKEVQHNIAQSGYNIDLCRMSSHEAVSRFADESVDFVYIDGDHRFDAVMMDLLQYVPKVKRNGIIVLHDYFRGWECGVVDAVDSYTRNHAVNPWYVTYDWSPTAFWQRSAEHA